MPARRSAAIPLAAVAAMLVVYASLYPLTGWDHPAGWSAWREVRVPWPSRWTEADAWLNVLGYLPLGALLHLAFVRAAGWRAAPAALAAIAVAASLSLAMEALQNFLPPRVPSSLDLAWNVAGATAGVVLAAGVQALGWLDQGASLHDRWFEPRRTGGTTLLLLWPVGLLIPTPVALGLGPQIGRIVESWRAPPEDAIAGEPGWPWLTAEALGPIASGVHFGPAVEAFTVALGLVGPSLVAIAIARPGWRRVALVAGAAAAGFGVLTLSTALNFGPQHALAWRTGPAEAGFLAGGLVALLAAGLPQRVAAALGLVALTALVILVAIAPADPYFAQSLKAWEQGRFVRLHGAAQWVGWLWPFAAMAYLLIRLAERRP
jgi:VanZ family protein